jgi:hypothetical protein
VIIPNVLVNLRWVGVGLRKTSKNIKDHPELNGVIKHVLLNDRNLTHWQLQTLLLNEHPEIMIERSCEMMELQLAVLRSDPFTDIIVVDWRGNGTPPIWYAVRIIDDNLEVMKVVSWEHSISSGDIAVFKKI